MTSFGKHQDVTPVLRMLRLSRKTRLYRQCLSNKMAYGTAVFWSGVCGAVAIYFLWSFHNRKKNYDSRQKPAREVILEATTKRLTDVQDTTAKNDESLGLNFVDAKPLLRPKEAENTNSDIKEKRAGGNVQSQASFTHAKVNAEVEEVYKVKVKSEELVHGKVIQDNLLPISRPLTSVDEVYQWIQGYDHFNVASVPLRPVEREFPNKPKTLVCHDMKGGYLEDRFVQGYNSTTCYRITEWNSIDTFVYFSHNIVTIPPPCWTNACHRHGVKVLGTFIAEWDEGKKICSQLLDTKESCQRFAKKLVDIACYYNFDGWLVNIECTISPDKIEDLIHFLGFLTQSMHKAMPSSEIIWYDSVTSEGELNWQNELNGKNSGFFDACDGIFLNYTWSVHNLAHSSLVAGTQRKFDVYVGVDCFGRGCFGGGGWNTYKPMQLIRAQNLSAAIFAPGWVYETHGEENFTENQSKFFKLLMPYLYLHMVKYLPLVSSFSQGYGNHYFSNGAKLMNLPWTNLSCQDLQPTLNDEYYKSGTRQGIDITDVFYCTDDAFEGGGSLKVNGKLDSGAQDCRVFFRLFKCDCKLPSEFIVSYTIKISQAKSVEVYLSLVLGGKPNYILLSPFEKDQSPETKCDYFNIGGKWISASCKDVEKRYVAHQGNYMAYHPIFGESKLYMDQLCHNEKGQSNNWYTRYYLIEGDDLPALKEIRLVCMPRKTGSDLVPQFSFLLGQVQVMSVEELIPCFPQIANIRCRDTQILHSVHCCILNTTILWDKEFGLSTKDTPILHYNIFSNASENHGFVNHDSVVFLGKAYVESFRVHNLKVEANRKSIEICIRPVTEWGMKSDKKQWGFCIIEW